MSFLRKIRSGHFFNKFESKHLARFQYHLNWRGDKGYPGPETGLVIVINLRHSLTIGLTKVTKSPYNMDINNTNLFNIEYFRRGDYIGSNIALINFKITGFINIKKLVEKGIFRKWKDVSKKVKKL